MTGTYRIAIQNLMTAVDLHSVIFEKRHFVVALTRTGYLVSGALPKPITIKDSLNTPNIGSATLNLSGEACPVAYTLFSARSYTAKLAYDR